MLAEYIVKNLVDNKLMELYWKFWSVCLQSKTMRLAVVAAFPLAELALVRRVETRFAFCPRHEGVVEVAADGARIRTEAQVQAIVVDVPLVAGADLIQVLNLIGARDVGQGLRSC